MIGIEEKLTELVDELRHTCREDDWWDCKETHYEDRAAFGTLKIFHYSTQMFSWQCTMLDGGRMTAPCPETEFIPYRSYGARSICLRFYVASEIQYIYWCPSAFTVLPWRFSYARICRFILTDMPSGVIDTIP